MRYTNALSTSAVLVMLWLLSGCASFTRPTTSSAPAIADTTTTGEIHPQAWTPLPNCIQVKTIGDAPAKSTLGNDLKESLQGHIAAKGYSVTDRTCAYSFEANFTQSDQGFFGFFSRSTMAAQAQLNRSTDHATLWTASAMIDFSDGALPFSLVGISSGIYKASSNLGRDKELMAIDSLSRQLINTLPYLPPSPARTSTPTAFNTDIDEWLATVPELDRAQALQERLQTQLSPAHKEKIYARLCQLENTPRNWRNWASFRASSGDPEGAIELIDKSALTSSNDPQTQFLKARMYSTLGQYAQADAAYVRAIGLNPDQPLYLEGLAWVNTQRQNYPRAIAAYKKVLALQPDQPYLMKNIANLSARSGEPDAAIALYQDAAERYYDQADKQGLRGLRTEFLALVAAQLIPPGAASQSLSNHLSQLIAQVEKKP